MSRQTRPLFALAVVFLLAVPAFELQAQTPAAAPDADLYTTYSGTYGALEWIVCGSTSESSGCYGSGSLGPFVAIGAMLEGNPSVSGSVVTRAIYIVDSGANPAVLYVYTKTDTVSATFDTVSVTLTNTINLPLTGGTNVSASMAANSRFLFIGTDGGDTPVRVTKSNLHLQRLTDFSGGTLSITSDEYGYVSVEQAGAFTVYGPNGALQEDGGGDQFMLGTTQAMPGSALVGSPSGSALHVNGRNQSVP
jgi:hypothetical protein